MIKKFFSNNIVIGVLVTVISAFIVSAITAIYKQINIFQAIKQVIQRIISFFSYRLPIYGFLLIIIGFIIIIEIIKRSTKNKKSNGPEWLEYKKDYYKNWLFAWDYYFTSNYQYAMKDLRPICKCGCELSLKDSIGNTFYSYGVLVCPKCNTTYPYLDKEILEDFKKIVSYNIKNNKYPKNYNEEPYQ
jgi:Type II secretory pathway, component PulF